MLKLFNRKKKDNKGFTLVELVIVIAILAILVGILAPQYTKYVEKSRKSADASNLDEMVKAVQVYAADAENEIKAIKGATIELRTDEPDIKGDSQKGDIAEALKEFCPDYKNMKMKSAKWGGNPKATIDITDEGAVTVTYEPKDFAEYINKEKTPAAKPGTTKPGTTEEGTK